MNAPRRLQRGFTLVEIMIVVVIIGMLAALSLPAFHKVRMASQDKAVMNNLRQLAAAADQYFMETGATTVAQTSLIGANSYVKNLPTVAFEVYPAVFTQGITITVTNVGSSRVLTFTP